MSALHITLTPAVSMLDVKSSDMNCRQEDASAGLILLKEVEANNSEGLGHIQKT